MNEILELIGGLKQHCAGQTLTLRGVPVKADDIITQLEAVAAALAAVPPARSALADKVKVVNDLLPAANAQMVVVHEYVQLMFGNSSTTLGDFGLAPRAKGKKSIAVKAGAIEKSAATREARHTMGSKQKAQIHGAASAEPEPTAPAAPTPAWPVTALKQS